MNKTIFLQPITILGLIVLPVGRAVADETAADQQLYESTVKSVVWVVRVDVKTSFAQLRPGVPAGNAMVNRLEIGSGTGAVIDTERRLVVTNAHVVGPYNQVFIFFPLYIGKKPITDRNVYWNSSNHTSGTVVAKDSLKDLAIIRLDALPGGIPAIPLAETSPSVGERLHSIGNPGRLGRMWVFKSGELLEDSFRKTGQRRPGEREDVGFVVEGKTLILKWPSQQGESGSPIFNERGELVGVLWGGREQTVATEVSELKTLLNSEQLTTKLPRAGTPKSADKAKTRGRSSPVKEPASTPSASVAPSQNSEVHETPEEEATRKLHMAKSLADAGVKAKARERYEEIIAKYPGTKAAKEAAQLLEELDLPGGK
jgi:hypothetical protein